MKKFLKKTLSLGLCLSSVSLLLGEIAVEPINLERVVIKGYSKRVPLRIKKEQKISFQEKKKIPLAEQPSFNRVDWSDSLKIHSGSFDSLSVENSFYVRNQKFSAGTFFSHQKSNGFREGYQKNIDNYELEFSQKLTHSRYQYHVKTQYLKNEYDLPDKSNTNFKGRTRKEDGQKHKVTLQSVEPGVPYQLSLELQNSNSHDNTNINFDTSLVRLGFLLKKKKWETVFSVEKETREQYESFLVKLFLKKSTKIMSDKTKLHLGLGTNLFFLNNVRANSTGFLSIVDHNGDEKGVAFSPYIQLDHKIDKKTIFYVAYTQFYDKEYYLDTNFNRPELNLQDATIQPTLNMQLDGGVRYNLSKSWKGLLAGSLHRYHNKTFLSEDLLSTNRSLTVNKWSKGYKSEMKVEVMGVWSEFVKSKTEFTVNSQRWKDPNINFTPYEANVNIRNSIKYNYEKFSCGIEHHWMSSRKSYPIIEKLDAVHLFDLNAIYRWKTSLGLSLAIKNVFNTEYSYRPDYSEEGFNILGGVNIKL